MVNMPNPYVGPRTIATGERLYGRENELRQLRDQLLVERIVVLHAPSGAGKSSLINAGLLPLMREENFNIFRPARVSAFPEHALNINRYVFSVMAGLEEGLPPEQRLTLDQMASLTLDDYLTRCPRPEDAPPSQLLVIDQFEEVFTLDPTDLDAKAEFFHQLGAALRNRDRYAVLAMREDYLGALEPYRRFIPGRLSSSFRLGLLNREAALEAVTRPAANAGVDFSQDAARRLVEDLSSVQVQQPDGSIAALPGPYVDPAQLQVALLRLWENRPQDASTINMRDFEQMGSVDEALEDFYASRVADIANMTLVPEREIRQWIGSRLITGAGTRSQVIMGAEKSEGLNNQVINRLQDDHLVRTEKRGGATWFELAHDRLVQPVQKSNREWFALHVSVFQRQADLWDSQGRPDGLLLRGQDLAAALEQADRSDLTAREAAFLDACRQTEQAGARKGDRQRLVLIWLAALLGVSLLANVILLVLLARAGGF